MATLDQIYRAYLNEDPNVSQMKYDPFSWNIEQTFDDTVDDTTTTLPATGGITSAYTGGGGGGGAGYVPDYGNPYYMEDDPDDPFFMQREGDPSLLKRFGIGAKNFLGGITDAFPNMINRAIGRPPDAIYSYPGDVTGYGSRAGITQEELRNMELLEQMGGINEKGQDIYGINVVSGFGNYTAYNEKRVTELKKSLANAEKKYGGKTSTYYDMTTRLRKELEDRTGLQTGIDEDEAEMDAMIMKKEKEARDIRKGLKEKKDDIISTGTMIGEGPLHDVTAPPAHPGLYTPIHGSGDKGQHTTQQGGVSTAGQAIGTSRSAPQDTQDTGSTPTNVGNPFGYRAGGRIRYGNGGIVDLL